MAIQDDADFSRANHRFIAASMQAPLLSREREFLLASRWREERDVAALHELVRAYARLVIANAGRFRSYGLAMGDLIQEGTIGLMQAAERFEPTREVRFSTYAIWWIRSAMQDFVLRNWSIVRTGTTAAQKTLFFNLRRLRAQIEETSGRPFGEDGRRQLAQSLDIEVREIERMEQRLAAADQSLNAPVGIEGDDEWQDFLVDERPSPEDLVIDTRDHRTRSRWLAEALGELSPRERRIIEHRRLRDEAATLDELAREFGVSKERVRQVEQRALVKLRQSMDRLGAAPADLGR